MTIEEIKELIRVSEETGIAELEVQRGDNRVRIRRAVASMQDVVLPVHSQGAVVGPAAILPIAPPQSIAQMAAAEKAAEDEKTILVTSPMVGTYYEAPAENAAPFVKVGDRVQKKKVLCIIESMKLMNDIEAEISGVVVAKLVENGRPVEYGEALFAIRPE